MGTNYYARINQCKECGRYEDIHLGKSSCGWKFCFAYNDGKYYKNVEEMKLWLKDKDIYDEYDNKISYEEFWEMVRLKKVDPNNKDHLDETGDDSAFHDKDGHIFISGWFS